MRGIRVALTLLIVPVIAVANDGASGYEIVRVLSFFPLLFGGMLAFARLAMLKAGWKKLLIFLIPQLVLLAVAGKFRGDAIWLFDGIYALLVIALYVPLREGLPGSVLTPAAQDQRLANAETPADAIAGRTQIPD